MRRIVVSVVLVVCLLTIGLHTISAHPARSHIPNYPTGYKGPRISDHPAGACAGNWNWWDTTIYNPGSGSIKVAAGQEWEGDASNVYCGVMRAVIGVESIDGTGEPMTQYTAELFQTDGTFIGGGSASSTVDAGLNSWQYGVSGDISAACGVYFHAWGSWLESSASVYEDHYLGDILEYPDGDSVGTYGPTHHLCYT